MVSIDYLHYAPNNSILETRKQQGKKRGFQAQFSEKHQKPLDFDKVTKPLQLKNIMAYSWKDNVLIFHLAPKVASCSTFQF